MSIPSKVLRCSACENTTNTFILYRNLRYLFKNTDIRIPKTLGYCHDCDALGVIENFENINYELEEVKDYSAQAIKSAKSIISFNLSPRMIKWRSTPAQKLTSLAYFFAIALKRKGDERCLRCLGHNVIKFNGDMNIPYSSASCYEETRNTGFYHPGCGGEYIVSGSEARFSIGQEPKYFNVSENGEISNVNISSKKNI
jgi:hypothetical protein